MERRAHARWSGDLKSGEGSFGVGSGAFEGPYSFVSRFEGSGDTNPEELLGAAHAGCFSMALAHALAQDGKPATQIETTAKVHLEKGPSGFAITRIDLVTRGQVPGIDDADFLRFAQDTKVNCIVSRALGAVPITLDAALEI